MAEREYKDSEGNVVTLDKLVRIEPEWAANVIRWYESKLDQCLRVVREYVSSELADDPSQDDPSCQLYPLIELVRKRPEER